jgi:hypothetical protein
VRTARLAAAGLLAAGIATPAAGQSALVAGESVGLSVDGYLRAITLLHDRGFDLPLADAPARESGLHSQVVRLRWRLEGSRWRVEVHDRLQVRMSSEEALDPAIGFGVGAEPDRLVNLRTRLLDRERVQAWHDLDRLSLTVHTGPVDLTLGRQAVTWGISTLFPVADLWTTFGPFEQDTEEKPGIDAARALFYPATGVEVDAVVAHRGDRQNLSAGARATVSRPRADVWAGGGKFWRQLMAMGGVTVLGDRTRWRAEAVLPWDLDREAFQRPRATAGVDWLGGTRFLGLEYHYNGIGRSNAEHYLETALDPRFRRGETYHLGRHYAGAVGSWSPDPEARMTLALGARANLGDRSAVFTPTFSYDIGQSVRFALGGLVSLGAAPRFLPAPGIRTEFGTYGDAVFTTLSVYF